MRQTDTGLILLNTVIKTNSKKNYTDQFKKHNLFSLQNLWLISKALKPTKKSHSCIHPFSQQIFTKYLRYGAGCWGVIWSKF